MLPGLACSQIVDDLRDPLREVIAPAHPLGVDSVHPWFSRPIRESYRLGPRADVTAPCRSPPQCGRTALASWAFGIIVEDAESRGVLALHLHV